MEFSVLGPVRGWHDGQPVALGGRQRRCVLAVLLLRVNQVAPLERLVELVWGEHPPVAVHNAVQTHVSRLRKALALDPDAGIEAVPSGYVLRLPSARVDLHRFRRLVAEAGEAGDPGRSGELLVEALALWQGWPLADVAVSDPLQRLCASLEEERLAALQQRLEVDLRLGRHAVVLGELADLAAAYPTREGIAGLWILALYRCGRQADALAELHRIRTRMVDELGIEPGPALRALQQRILRADPALDSAPGPVPAGVVRPVRQVRPAQLPADVAGFHGRARELAALDALLPDPTRPHGAVLVTLTGTAGVGKTALAVHWAHRVRDAFPDGQLYLDLRGYDQDRPMTDGEALVRFLEALGVAAQDIPVDVDARADRFRSEVADRRMLILLDNALSVAQLRALLPGTASCMVMVTSRDNMAGLVALHGATRLALEPLPQPDATALLRYLLGGRAATEPDATIRLAEQCARLPLAIRVAAELAASRLEIPLTELADELADGRRRLRLLDVGGDVRAAVRAVFSWSYRHLPADVARLFRLLGWHLGRDIDRRAAAALGGLDPDESARLLGRLVQAHMIERRCEPGAEERYGMHDLLRAYAAELAAGTDPEADLAAARRRLLDFYLAAAAAATGVLYPVAGSQPPPTGAQDALLPPVDDPDRLRAWLNAERLNLVTACTHAATHGHPAHAVRLAATLYRYLESGHYIDALTVHTHGLRAARQLGDRGGEAHALTNLGLVHRLLGRYGPATEDLRQALELHRQTGDRAGEARTLSNLGIVSDRLGRHADAERELSQALDRFREIGDRHGTARALTNFGGLRSGLGRHTEAAEHLTEAATLFRELGDQAGEASALTNLGETEMWLGRHTSAAGHLETALTRFRHLNHRYGQAVALSNLGTVCSRLGRHDLAVEHLGAALAIFRDIGHRYGEASVHNGLGEALHAAGRDGALAEHAAAERIATETGDRDELARAHTGAAGVHHDRGDLGRAREHWQHALRLHTEVGSPHAEEIRARLVELEAAEVR